MQSRITQKRHFITVQVDLICGVIQFPNVEKTINVAIELDPPSHSHVRSNAVNEFNEYCENFYV